MLSLLTLARLPGHRRPFGLLAVIFALAPALAPSRLKGQTADTQEISSREVEPTFKLQAERNLVMVRVVVRDSKGTEVDNLRQEDFHLFDHGKLQTIVHFSIEKPDLKVTEAPRQKPAPKTTTAEAEAADETAIPTSTARRFMAMYFDDVNTPIESLVRARDAADHFLTSSVQPGDRVALYTASGQKQVDFTDNLAQVHQALFELRERPMLGDDRNCDQVPPYEAYLIIEMHDPIALGVATNEMLNCTYGGNTADNSAAQNEAMANAMLALSRSETQSTAALRGIESIVRRLTSLPGQRSMVIVSAGFLTETLRFDLSEIADRALRAGVTINALDARGLYTDPSIPDASQGYTAYSGNAWVNGEKSMMLQESARRQTDGMQSLALDTGGVFFNNSNDLDTGFRKAAAPPAAFYLLAFSPQNLKLDGTFHPIQVKLTAPRGYSVEARRGYYAPRKPTDSTEQEKEEIEEAVFSQDETHELPIDVHTQFFMKAESAARITVLTHLDLHALHFRKEGDRNLDNLTFVTVVFDQDGHAVTGKQSSVQMRLRDGSLDRYLQTGVTSRTLFDVKPGTYLVRSVVRDSESGQISGLNRTVEIPY